MRFLIWGAGAIGGTMGAYLARAGHDVTFVDTVAEHVAAINADGISDHRPIAEFTQRVPAFTPETLTRRVGHDHPRDQGAPHRGRHARAAAAPERRRLRDLGAERAQRARRSPTSSARSERSARS